MTGTFIGYFPKRRASRSGWVSPFPDHPDAPFPAPPPVEEICSVSHCIAAGPTTGPDTQTTNPFGGYRSPDEAWHAVLVERPRFCLYAYWLLPVLLRDGKEERLAIDSLDVEPLPEGYDCLGYDAVELTHGQCLGCSPLSCNGQTEAAVINRFCLVNSEPEGIELARLFSIEKPEPGPYAVIEVWRERSQRS